jgi:hypothetical protein
MRNSIRHVVILFGAFLVLTISGTLEQASAISSPWARGAHTSTLPTGTVDVIAYVDVPNNPGAVGDTLNWIGARSSSGGTTYLSQPELRYHRLGPDDWRVSFELVHGETQDEFYWSNMYCNAGAEVTMYNAILSDGRNFQSVEYRSGTCTGSGVSKWMDDDHYGTSYTQAFTTFESYETDTSDLSPMNGSFQFTSFRTSTTYTGWTTKTLTADSGGTPPSCVTSAGGSGTNTITVNC